MSDKRIDNFRVTPEMIREARKRKKRNLYIKRMLVRGSVTALTAGVVGLGIVGCKNFLDKSDEKTVDVSTTVEDSYTIDTSVEDLSTLNVVLVNDGISSEQMEQAESTLAATGLDVEVRDINELNKDGTECFVALTNYEGDDYKVIGNYNKGNNHADLLAIGMKEAFSCNLQKGVYDKEVAEPVLIPSNIEKAVGDQIMPNVTIAIPEGADLEDYGEGVIKVDTGLNDSFTDSLLEGLARYNDSLNYVDIHNSKFLLRPSDDADYQQSVDPDVLRLNGLDTSYGVMQDSILLNKGLPDSLSNNVNVNIEKVDVKGNSLN